MGRTLEPWSRLVDEEEASWSKFRRALRAEDRPFLDRVFRWARYHAPAAVYAARPVPFETIVMAALVEVIRRIDAAERPSGAIDAASRDAGG